jgi:hypothetical protein
MSRNRLVIVLALLAVLGGSLGSASAFVITDPRTTVQNMITAVLKSQLVETVTEEGRRIRRMARRLSAFSDVSKYAVADTPRWRSYRYQGIALYATPYNEALNFGDPGGAAYAQVARTRASIELELADLRRRSPAAADAIAAQLATLDLADSTIISGTDQNGRLRPQGKREMRAIDALERDVTNPDLTQSTTAVLDKISAAVLIETRQKQSRLQFLTALLEQLAVDNKRGRDTEAAAMNMQLGRIRAAADCSEGCRGFLTGAANDLRTWRQP